MAIIQLLLQLIPLFKTILDLFIKTPEEKRLILISDLHSAFNSEKLKQGDTSDLEAIIKKGK